MKQYHIAGDLIIRGFDDSAAAYSPLHKQTLAIGWPASVCLLEVSENQPAAAETLLKAESIQEIGLSLKAINRILVDLTDLELLKRVTSATVKST